MKTVRIGTRGSPLALWQATGNRVGHAITVRAFVSDLDATSVIRVMHHGTDADALAISVADELRARGALALLETS